MCIVIDANVFSSIFDGDAADHDEFRPVFNWIENGKGKIVYGGTKYKIELRAATKYLKLFAQLAIAGKTRELDSKAIDRKQEELERKINHRDFDDAHIIAIIIVSHCKLICSKDTRAYPFFQDKNLYPKNFFRPKIYSRSSHAHLLCDQNIAKCCK